MLTRTLAGYVGLHRDHLAGVDGPLVKGSDLEVVMRGASDFHGQIPDMPRAGDSSLIMRIWVAMCIPDVTP
jgi:hypothetical protein